MGSVMMRVVSAARGAGGGAGAGCAGRQAAGNGGKRPAGSMAGAGEGGGSAGLLRHRRAPRTWPRARGPAAASCCCRPGNPAGFINGRADVIRGAPPPGGPALPLKRPPHGGEGVGGAVLCIYRHPSAGGDPGSSYGPAASPAQSPPGHIQSPPGHMDPQEIHDPLDTGIPMRQATPLDTGIPYRYTEIPQTCRDPSSAPSRGTQSPLPIRICKYTPTTATHRTPPLIGVTSLCHTTPWGPGTAYLHPTARL